MTSPSDISPERQTQEQTLYQDDQTMATPRKTTMTLLYFPMQYSPTPFTLPSTKSTYNVEKNKPSIKTMDRPPQLTTT